MCSFHFFGYSETKLSVALANVLELKDYQVLLFELFPECLDFAWMVNLHCAYYFLVLQRCLVLFLQVLLGECVYLRLHLFQFPAWLCLLWQQCSFKRLDNFLSFFIQISNLSLIKFIKPMTARCTRWKRPIIQRAILLSVKAIIRSVHTCCIRSWVLCLLPLALSPITISREWLNCIFVWCCHIVLLILHSGVLKLYSYRRHNCSWLLLAGGVANLAGLRFGRYAIGRCHRQWCCILLDQWLADGGFRRTQVCECTPCAFKLVLSTRTRRQKCLSVGLRSTWRLH